MQNHMACFIAAPFLKTINTNPSDCSDLAAGFRASGTFKIRLSATDLIYRVEAIGKKY
jgi:hypothetical protein